MADIDTLADSQSGDSCLDSLYDDLVEVNAEIGTNKSEFDAHEHSTGATIVISIVASFANLGTGTTDGQMKLAADTNKLYAWDTTGSAWKPMSISVFKSQLFS